MGIEVGSELSPSVQQKCVASATRIPSYEEASENLKDSAELEVCPKRIERLVNRIGAERQAEEQAEVEAFEQLSLPEQRKPPVDAIEDVAVIGVDGGRLQVFDRSKAKAKKKPDDVSSQAADVANDQADDRSPDKEASVSDAHVERAAPTRSKHWKESKVGCLMKFESEVSQEDPHPELPDTFLDPQEIHRISREIGHPATGVEPPTQDPQSDTEAAAPSEGGKSESGGRNSNEEEASPEQNDESPKRIFRKVAATRGKYESLGRLLKAWCWALGFTTAARKAFIGDGDHKIWNMQQRLFSTFTPIVDFVHANSYVYQAAMAGRSHDEGWAAYVRWAQWLWAGEVPRILAELRLRADELGTVQKTDSPTSARFVVHRALTYLTNHQDKMKYAQYRREGLPITTCNVETTVKQINYRVKGTEKFWSEKGSSAMLQLRADRLSDGNPLEEFWAKRAERMTGFRNYKSRVNCAAAA